MKKKMNEKGVSTLIETVLIIGFTIVLAAVVMTWGGQFRKNFDRKTISINTNSNRMYWNTI